MNKSLLKIITLAVGFMFLYFPILTFIELFCSIKDLEVNAYNKIITAWEREYLLLNV